MRFLTAFVGAAVLMILAASGTAAQIRPDFSGTWTLDPASASAGGMKPPQQLTFTQTADTVTMSWTQEGRKITETFHLDGSESKTQSGTDMRATWEANTIVVVIRANLGGNMVEQRRVLSIDGGNLVFELTMPDPGGGNPTIVRVVYKKG